MPRVSITVDGLTASASIGPGEEVSDFSLGWEGKPAIEGLDFVPLSSLIRLIEMLQHLGRVAQMSQGGPVTGGNREPPAEEGPNG